MKLPLTVYLILLSLITVAYAYGWSRASCVFTLLWSAWCAFIAITSTDHSKRLIPLDLKTRWQWLKIAWWRLSIPDGEYVIQFKDGTFLDFSTPGKVGKVNLEEAIRNESFLYKGGALHGLARLLDARPVLLRQEQIDAVLEGVQAIYPESLNQPIVTPPEEMYYALQYPDGSYAIESNCQGWLSTNQKPKIGDDWCFTQREALWNIKHDLTLCKLVRITE